MFFAPTTAGAQVAPNNLVSVCSGVSLPPSAVTSILNPVLTGIVSPVQTAVNGTLTALAPVTGLILPTPLNIDLTGPTGLLTVAAGGTPISLQAVASDGTLVSSSSQCNAAADGYTLDTAAGLAIGGNRITGLGGLGLEASAGEINSIALGNNASTTAAAVGSVAIGSGASATASNAVALGTGSVADRGALSGYAAFGLSAPQNSAGSVSVGAVGAERQITNVAAGSAPTDAANLAQVQAAVADVVAYDDATHTVVTLDGAGGTLVTGVAPGALTAASTDAVNGSQLFATNQQVTANTTAITNLTVAVNGGAGPLQYSNPGSPTTPNGGTATNDVTLVGAVAGPVGLHNVATGSITAGSTDAINGGQLFGLTFGVQNAVLYESDAVGNRLNNIQLVGGNTAAPVTIGNVGAGAVNATSTQAVNGSQLFLVDAAVVEAQATADQALVLGQNSVQYDNASRNSVTLGNPGSPTALRNVASGVAATDAVNVGQLNSAVNAANALLDSRVTQLGFDLRGVARAGRAGSAAALAAAALPQPITAGGGMVSVGVGTYRGRSAFALGASKVTPNGKTILKLGVTYDSSDHVGANAGVGFGF